MPYTQQGIPFRSGAGAHTSHKAARRAAADRPTKTRAYLRLLARRGPLTDHEARMGLGYQSLSTICSIRNGALNCGLVKRGLETRPSPYGGNDCWTWELTAAGRQAVQAMREPA